jgi:dUTP pyrophosphatase
MSYSGNDDIWKFPAIAFKDITVFEGDRICQFRIQPSQKASVWTKIKWLFTNKIEFVEVEDLCNNNRGGFGSTGLN